VVRRNAVMSRVKEIKPRFRVGDWVSFLFGTSRATAQIVEDRGPIGVNGRRLYEVKWVIGADAVWKFPMPEEDLELAKPPDGVSREALVN